MGDISEAAHHSSEPSFIDGLILTCDGKKGIKDNFRIFGSFWVAGPGDQSYFLIC